MRLGVCVLFALLLAVGCVPPYRPPTADQPHAVIKLRRSYDTTAGTTLRESVEVDEHSALSGSVASSFAGAARTDAILAHPLPATFAIHAGFFHTESRFVRESYQESHTTYDYESYDCSSGFGTSKSYRTCSRTVPHTHYETKYRDVWRQVEVGDGECAAALRFFPQDQHVYLLQYTYHAHSVCSLSCFEQVAQAGGTFQNLQCPAAPPTP
ncbi:MAG TPA: hypothetical protein VNG33_09705 [Polyangiaceae bacterium]|nr:hypothetical protein [Polyangiaceae bacterium]